MATKLEIADVLHKSYDVMRRRGFTQGTNEDPATKAVCAQGAIYVAVEGDDVDEYRQWSAPIWSYVDALESTLNEGRSPYANSGHYTSLVGWSDSEGRTQDEVEKLYLDTERRLIDEHLSEMLARPAE